MSATKPPVASQLEASRPNHPLTAVLRPFNRSEWGLVVAIVAVVVLTALVDRQHIYWTSPRSSIIDILRQTAMLGIFSLGAAIVIIAGGIDLSNGSVIAFSGTICASIMVLIAPEQMRNAEPLGTGVLFFAVTGTLLVGFLIGSLHAWLITVVGLPPFVATLATLVGLRSFGRAIMQSVAPIVLGGPGTQIQIYDERFREWTQWVPFKVGLFLVLAALAWLLMARTVTGRHLYALGGNENAARLSGIRTDRLKWLAYCLSAVLSSVAGILYIGDQSVADPQTLGQGYELNAIAAAVVGGCSLQGGAGTISGVVLGALFLRTVIDGVAKMIKTGADVYEGLIVGGVVVVAVAFNQFRQAGRQGKRFFAGLLGVVTMVNLALVTGVLVMVALPTAPHPTNSTSAAPGLPSPVSIGAVVGVLTLAFLWLVRFLEGRRARH